MCNHRSFPSEVAVLTHGVGIPPVLGHAYQGDRVVFVSQTETAYSAAQVEPRAHADAAEHFPA